MTRRNARKAPPLEAFCDSGTEHGCGSSACEARRAGLPRRDRFGFTPAEETALDVMRLVLSAHMSADVRFWNAAIEHAGMRVGDRFGPALVAQVTALTRALRLERTVAFSFLTFGCNHISSDELDLMSMLQTVSLGPHNERQDALCHLAHGEGVRRLEQAALDLARVIDAIEHDAPFARVSGDGTPAVRLGLH